MMKKMITLLAGAVMIISLTACGSNKNSASNNADVQLPNPFSECSSLEEAAKNTGFSFDVPDSLDGYAQRTIRTMVSDDDSSMIEVIYQNKADENTDITDEIRMRKANGDKDISGDYNEYSEINTITVGDISVTLKGNDDHVNLAVWTANGYTYSIGAYSESGISEEEMSDLVASIQ